jgi:hypothetical protein
MELKNHQLSDGEITDPLTGKPLPAGRYNLRGRMRAGGFVPSKIEPSTDLEIGKVDPDKYEPGSIAKFKKTNNYADLIPRDRADKRKLTLDVNEVLESQGVDPQTATPQQIQKARGQVQQEKIRAAAASREGRDRSPSRVELLLQAADGDARAVKALEIETGLRGDPLKKWIVGQMSGSGGQSTAPLATGPAAPGLTAPIPVRPARPATPAPGQPQPTPSASTSPAGPIRQKSKSGKPMISTDGGKTWQYE